MGPSWAIHLGGLAQHALGFWSENCLVCGEQHGLVAFRWLRAGRYPEPCAASADICELVLLI